MAYEFAVEDPKYQPAMRVITAITQAFPAEVTTSFDHNYGTGLRVRFFMPDNSGMIQLNRLFGLITVTGDTTFLVDIDTSSFTAFTAPGASETPAQVVPMGESTFILTQATRNVLPPIN